VGWHVGSRETFGRLSAGSRKTLAEQKDNSMLRHPASFGVFIFVAVTSGCNVYVKEHAVKESTFMKEFQDCSMNSEILFLPETENRVQDLIDISFKNDSLDPIIFPPDLNVRILTFDSDRQSWTELKNDMQYSSFPNSYVIVESGVGLSSYSGISVIPIPLDNEPINIRIVITGNPLENDVKTEKCVGAFIDTILKP
jgi:hypothetical protein